MSQTKHIIIIGAGPGGLCAGMLLSQRGFKVSVFDSHDEVGGRNRPIHLGQYTFDTGPTFLLMKHVLDEMFTLCGKQSEDYLEFIKLDPMYRLQFSDRQLNVYSDKPLMRDELARVFPEGCNGYDAFLTKEAKRFASLYPCIKRDYSSLTSFLSLDLLRALPQLALTHSVFSNLGQYFNEAQLRLVFSFQSKYLGMSPWQCPALFTMLSYLEHEYGIYHVKGGLNQISAAMAKVITEQGGAIHTGQPVAALELNGKTVTGVKLADGKIIQADAVVINADFAHAMSQLVKPNALKRYKPEKLANLEYSCSTFMLYLALDKCYDSAHHTIVFAEDYTTNINNIFHFRLPGDDFSFYVQNASVSDASLAPPGCSGLYVLVPMPNNNSGLAWDELCANQRERVLDALASRLGLTDIRAHIVAEKIITPNDWQASEHVYKGATFSLSHKFSQLLYWRPHNRFEELNQCYLVGGGTHPGSGLPTIYESAHISAKLLCRDFNVDFAVSA
ncbi:phytoene desaturase family protein [Methylocucumis oryzae]|uniref:Phytoene desaturase n=1 Tax=Methylocucumis oryzae TaxID=1632867 RepID=A0A0F3IMC1_9GAMM|nr:phytoene desaturase family protein [Methylocucumis oryzae]KJV06689.1 phytoene desaturase [Methylocucumis oryzae]